MENQATSDAPAPRRKRGRPPGTRDAKPRVRRSRKAIAEGAPAPRAKPVRESDHQKQFIKWIDTQPAPDMPGMKLGQFCYAVPNGVWIPGEEKTRMRIIMSQRRLGMRKGAPDITLAFPVHVWHGCYIELKRDKSQTAPGKLDENQIAWLERLRQVGYYVRMCVGVEEACDAVREYLSGQFPPPFPWEEGGR